MRIEYWSIDEVNEDGTIGDPVRPGDGAVCTEPRMETSGMHHLQTRSTERDGLWLMVTTGRLPTGECHGITVYFQDEKEMSEFEQARGSGPDHRLMDDLY